MSDKKYYWLKLKEDFFDDKVIKYLRKLPEGDALVIIYLKMQLKSLKAEGFIKYDNILPSYEEELALVLDEDINTVKFAINALLKLGVVERWENDMLYMVSMQQLIGKETAVAERVRKHRASKLINAQNEHAQIEYNAQNEHAQSAQIEHNEHAQTVDNKGLLQCNTEVTKCNTEIEIEIEKELELEKEKKKNKELEIEKHFTSFWSIYPKKTDKKRALKIFKTALKNHDIETILSGTEKYALHIKQSRIESQYIKHAATFLNNESFLNEYETKKEVDALGYDISQYKDIF